MFISCSGEQNTGFLMTKFKLYYSERRFVFVFVALHPMSTAMVIAGRSVLLTTLFPGQA